MVIFGAAVSTAPAKTLPPLGVPTLPNGNIQVPPCQTTPAGSLDACLTGPSIGADPFPLGEEGECKFSLLFLIEQVSVVRAHAN